MKSFQEITNTKSNYCLHQGSQTLHGPQLQMYYLRPAMNYQKCSNFWIENYLIHLQHFPTVFTKYSIFSVKCTKPRGGWALPTGEHLSSPRLPNVDALVSAKCCQLSGHSSLETV